MNTYEALKLSDVPAAFQASVREFASKAIVDELLISVRLQDIYYDDEVYTDLYGVYARNEQEVGNYNSSGSVWYYYAPIDFLA